MFSLKSKLEPSLRYAIETNLYKSLRVNIFCKTLHENIERKVKTYKGTLNRSIPSIKMICANLSIRAIERILEYPEIRHISVDSYAHLCASGILSSNGVSFHQKHKFTGKGIGIGVIDSGVYPHPDLLNPSNKIRGFQDLLNGYRYPYDDNGHGTFICGLIAGSGYTSKGMYKGAAENSSLYCIKAFNSIGKGYVSDILYAIEHLIHQEAEKNIRVLCLPFELQFNDRYVLSSFSKLFDIAINKGIVPVVPAGSNGNIQGSITGVATLPNAITVGGIDTTSSAKPYVHSSSGPCGRLEKPDLAAACVDICSLNCNSHYISERKGTKIFPHSLDKPYTTFTGTSCSAAYISAITAMLLESNPNLSFRDVLALLKISCNHLEMPNHIQGSGMLSLKTLFP
jgi:serine protease AprX